MVLESNVTSRRQFVCLFAVVIFFALRALSHAYPAPLPWTSGVFDGEGVDDILQTIRIAYAKSDGVRHIARELLSPRPAACRLGTPSPGDRVILSSTHSRAPPSS